MTLWKWKTTNEMSCCKWMSDRCALRVGYRVVSRMLSFCDRRDVAKFVNAYPTLDVSYELAKGEYTAGAPIAIKVVLSRDADEEDPDDQIVVAPFYPVKKMANWWLVVGEPSTRQLHVIKRVTINKSLAVKLELTLPKGTHSLKLYVICDSYVGADHDLSLNPIDVAEGEESDEDEDEDEDDAME